MLTKIKNSYIAGLIIMLVAYALAIVSGIISYKGINLENELLKFLIADIIGTVVIFIFSMIFRNSSIYDPYWSVAPMVMAPLFAHLTGGINPYEVLIVALIEVWGLRLTLNCLKRFKNLNTMDWRYIQYKEKYHKTWPLISLGGIHLVPTFVVFIAMLPVFSYMNTFDTGVVEVNATLILSAGVCIFAIVIEMLADLQMDKFKKTANNPFGVNEIGLWKVSRHPNYFGEILFWFSMFLFSLSVNTNLWVLMFSPLVVFLLFVFISIPMMEKRQLKNKSSYQEYIFRTNMLMPFFKPTEEEIKHKKNKFNKKTK